MGTRILTRTLAVCLMAIAGSTTAAVNEVRVCVDYGCDITRIARLDDGQWQSLRQLFSRVGDARQERVAVTAAIGQLETIVGPQVGTAADLPANSADNGGIGQLDCIAESTNTDTYLKLLSDAGLLHFHRPTGRESRHPLLFNTHWTAVMEDTRTGAAYAVDSWYGANGDAALVLPLTAWRRGETRTDER